MLFRSAMANQMAASYQLEMGQGATAVQTYTQAIAALNNLEPTLADQHALANLYRSRSLAHRRQQQYDAASQDLQQATTLAKQLGDDNLVAAYQEDWAILQNHANHASKAVSYNSPDQ